ncbi:MAG: hypothetical protein ACTSPI_02330 [Candidatus Heimdallarchaeaceae archaeon]
MNRRKMMQVGIGSMFGLLLSGDKVEAKISKTDQEERTREYLDNLPEWDPKSFLEDEQSWYKEYLFTFGHERKDILDQLEKETGYALVYSPRHLVQKGHFFDLIYVKIGKRNVTRISQLWDGKGRGPNGGFLRLEDI